MRAARRLPARLAVALSLSIGVAVVVVVGAVLVLGIGAATGVAQAQPSAPSVRSAPSAPSAPSVPTGPAAPTAPSTPPSPPGAATAADERNRHGFDHAAHARALAASAAPPIACASCHPLMPATATGPSGALGKRPDHAACFGACHGAQPTRQEWPATAPPPAGATAPDDGADDGPALSARARTCLTCHAAADLAARRFAVAYPPYALRPDWIAPLPHGSHRQVECGSCHPLPGAPLAKPAGRAAAKPAAAHARCLGCHGAAATPASALANQPSSAASGAPSGSPSGAPATAPTSAPTFAMSECERCHRAAPPPAVSAPLTVTAAFSHQRHQRHAAKQHGAGKDGAADEAACSPCHRELASERHDGRTRPTAATCATAACHDGKAAFSITERCTQCHKEAPAGLYPVARPAGRFLHRQHAAAVASVGCQGCHRLGTGGLTVERAGHAACASCHAADFGAAQPVICGACHGSTEPWRPLRADRLPAESTEFGARLDHGSHAQPCQRCHTLDTRARQLRLPRDHSACAGSGCHEPQGGPAPALTACAECHQLELVLERDQQRRRAPWSVRQRFDHGSHRSDGSGAALACSRCHGDVSGPLATMATPKKRSCETCHDGRAAFSVTGTGCNRCHGGPR